MHTETSQGIGSFGRWSRGASSAAPVWDAVGLALRLLLAAVFIIFGWNKAQDPAEMRVAIRAYQLVPEWSVHPMAAVLPYLEIAAGVLLLLGLATRIGAVLTALMMLAFIFGIAWAIALGLNIDCGCSGGGGAVAEGETQYTWDMIRDIGLLIAAVYLTVRPQSWLAVDNLNRRDGDDDEYDESAQDAAATTVVD